jgi:hypothetical protein
MASLSNTDQFQNNPPAVEAAGRLVVSAAADIVDTAEKVEFSIGAKGVAVSGGTR